ncbi:MAG: alpha/beta hydrolase [Oscillospiraceae bacterium]|nr:alpha/beta hydrolase [Oscillospiraceae bacterium]
MKKVLLLHGYNGIPPVFNYLNEELKKLQYDVIMPSLPIKENIRYDTWERELESIIRELEGELIVIAHSCSNPFLIKYLSDSKLNVKLYIGLAGFSNHFVKEGRKDLEKTMESLIPSEDEIDNFKYNVKAKFCIYSDNDHLVPFEILKQHVKNIEGQDYMIPNVGHMGNRSNLQELPQVIEIVNKEG